MARVLFAPRALPPLPPDVAADPGPYADWARERERRRREEWVGRDGPVDLHLVLLVSGRPPPETVPTLHSLQQQTSARWLLTVVVEQASHVEFTTLLTVSGLQRVSQRVRVVPVPDGSTPAELLWAAMAANLSAPMALLAPGDVWAADAVAQLSSALPAGGVAYADEDIVDGGGSQTDPRLKPDYSPDFLLSHSYIGRPMAVGAEVVRHLAALEPSGTADLEHDLALMACELADEVTHVPEVLCHRLLPPAAPTFDDRHIVAALQRRGEHADVTPGRAPGTYRVQRTLASTVMASIVIPFRDEPVFLRACVDSIDATRGEQAVELVLVDNGSVQLETATLLDRFRDRPDVRVLTDDRPFNWAELNNAGARAASGDVLVFLNNDIEAQRGGWLSTLCAQARRPDIGAVGARLLYPDHRLQHCGVVIGLGGAAGHILVGLEESEPGYLHMAAVTRECAAVTGACLATRREVFDSLGGFDESLGVDLNDVDYCLRLQRGGLRVLCDPCVELIHHESPSRGTAGDVRDIVRFIDRWRDSIVTGDPYLNRHLTRVDSSCRLRVPNEKEWWQQWASNLSGE